MNETSAQSQQINIFEKLFYCSKTIEWYECFFDKTILISNFIALILLFYIVVLVYIFSRKYSLTDFRIIIMTFGIINSILVILNNYLFKFALAVQYFFVYDLLRFIILFCLCYMYSSIVTRNLLPMRKKILIFLGVFFWIVIILLIVFGVLLSIKLRANAKYAYILCTDPLLLCLKIGPFLASINFSIIIFLIK